MTQVVQAACPYCHNVLRIPADWLAQPMRCKFCKQVIQARGSAGADTEALPSAAGHAQAVAVAPPPVAAPLYQAVPPQSSAPAYAAAPPVARHGGDPFSFDEGPEPAPVASVRRKKGGRGWIVASVLLVSLSTIAVLVVVFFGGQLRELFQTKSPPQVAAKGDRTNPPDDGPGFVEPPSGKTNGIEKKPGTNDGGSGKKKSPVGVGPKTKTVERELFPRRALLISVNNYWVLNPVHYGTPQSPGYPGSSGSTLANRLTNAPMYFPATQVVELSDSAKPPLIPQKSVIEEAIQEFCNTSREQDRLLLLFAGHAIEIDKEAYLIPFEGIKEDVKTLIPLKWVYDQLAKCKARQKILVLDAFRNPPARGFELPGTGAMSEDFDAKLQNPPPGVQVWSSCVKDQQSIEFDGGSVFLQCLCHSMQDRLGGFASPDEAIPVETLLTKVNERMQTLLAKTEYKQVSRLSGKEPDSGPAYDAKEPLPPQLVLKQPEVMEGEDKAGGAFVNNILSELKQIPPMKESLRAYMDTLRAEAMPAFPKKVMDFYKADYKSWDEMVNKVKKNPGKYPLREAVIEAKAVLDKAEGLRMEEQLTGPINDKGKAAFLEKQKEPGKLIYELEEEALAKMVSLDTEEMRKTEESKRWLANFDYTMARLKARLVYIHEYNYILGDIRADRLPPLEGDASGWRLGFKPKLSTNESKVKTMAKDISKLWKRIGEEHPNTPWALLAQRESLYAMGLEWRASRE